MTATLLSFATKSYHAMQDRLHESAGGYFNQHLKKREADLPDWFREQHAQHFQYARGYGFWVWKPWLILKTLQQLKAWDFNGSARRKPPVLMYCDSQLVFINDPGPLFNLCRRNQGVLLFHQAREKRMNGPWTKRYCFEMMGCTDANGNILEKYEMGWQLDTAMSLWSPTQLAFDVLKEWYDWCSKFDVVCDDPKTRELKKFKDHRHDQSILSIIALKRGLQSYPDPSQWGNGYQEDTRGYGQIMAFRRLVCPPYKHPCYEPGGVTG